METKHFLDLLFNAEDHICLGRTAYDVEVIPIAEASEDIFSKAQFVALNPFKQGTTRKDANVSEFRNIVFELDTGTLEEQAEYLYGLELPISTLVFSGGKSLHAIISLESPAADAQAYRDLVQDFYAVVTKADPTCKNPSRFTRLGGVTRPDTNKIQEILDIQPHRTTVAEIQRFRAKNLETILKARAKNAPSPAVVLGPEARGELSVRTKDLLRIGVSNGQSRRRELYIAACDFKNQGYTLDETQARLGAAAQRMGLSNSQEVMSIIARAHSSAPFRPRVIK